jgi:hypothetical protein
MTNYPPQDEQTICVSCGFCCDHTLFEYASLSTGEKVSGHFEESRFDIDGSDYFKLPCPHFNEKCTIYDKQKPKICSSFKCKLLKNFSSGEIEKSNALSIIKEAKSQRQEIFELYEELLGKTTKSYREVLEFVNTNKEHTSKEFKVLRAKTNLLSILLVRYFKSKESFDELLVNDEE